MNEVELLRACSDKLVAQGDQFRTLVARTGQSDKIPAIMFERAFGFGRTTLEAMLTLAGTAQQFGVCVLTLARPFYEVAVRLLWASRAQHGWARLQLHWNQEDTKCAKRLVNIPSLAKHASTVLSRTATLEQAARAGGKKYNPTPDMKVTLEEVEKHDQKDGIKFQKTFAEYQYATLWGLMCRAAHAHMSAINRPSETHLAVAAVSATVSTFHLLRATTVVETADPAERVRLAEGIAHEMASLLKNTP